MGANHQWPLVKTQTLGKSWVRCSTQRKAHTLSLPSAFMPFCGHAQLFRTITCCGHAILCLGTLLHIRIQITCRLRCLEFTKAEPCALSSSPPNPAIRLSWPAHAPLHYLPGGWGYLKHYTKRPRWKPSAHHSQARLL